MFRSAFLEPRRAMVDPTGVILGARGKGRGGVNHLPCAKNVKSVMCYICCCAICCFPKGSGSRRSAKGRRIIREILRKSLKELLRKCLKEYS